jgi:hypothetical protein
VLEDSEITADALRADGYSETVIEALEALTKRNGETYEQFIERVAQHPLARRVKIADLEDNMNLQRLLAIGSDDVQRIEKYHKAWKRLVTIEQAASRHSRS